MDQVRDMLFDHRLSAEDEFRNWLDTVSRDPTGMYREPLPKTLDERIADKEKRIKRKIANRLRYQKVKAAKLQASQLDRGTLDEWVQKRLQ